MLSTGSKLFQCEHRKKSKHYSGKNIYLRLLVEQIKFPSTFGEIFVENEILEPNLIEFVDEAY